MKRLILAFLAALAMTGCASLNTSPETEMLAVKVATMKAIEAIPPEKRADQAKKIGHVTHEAAQWLTDSDANLRALQAHVSERIAEQGLEPSDQALADMLASAVADEIRARLPDFDAMLTPEQKVIVLDVLAAVEQAAAVYGDG